MNEEKKRKEIEKENYNYNARDKRFNETDLILSRLYDYVERKEGESERETLLLRYLEKEINEFRHIIDCYKTELSNIHYRKIEDIKRNV